MAAGARPPGVTAFVGNVPPSVSTWVASCTAPGAPVPAGGIAVFVALKMPMAIVRASFCSEPESHSTVTVVLVAKAADRIVP